MLCRYQEKLRQCSCSLSCSRSEMSPKDFCQKDNPLRVSTTSLGLLAWLEVVQSSWGHFFPEWVSGSLLLRTCWSYCPSLTSNPKPHIGFGNSTHIPLTPSSPVTPQLVSPQPHSEPLRAKPVLLEEVLSPTLVAPPS